MAAPVNDLSAWPLCRVTMPRAVMSANEFDAHVAFIDRLFLRGEPFALLIDARGATPLLAKQRQTIGQSMRQSFQRYPHGMVGVAVVMSSALERGVFTAIIWAAGKTFPTRAFSTPEQAEAWLRASLAPRVERRPSPRT